MIDKYLAEKNCIQLHTLGKVEAQLEEHTHQIKHLNECVEHKRRRLDNLEIVDAKTILNFENLEKRVIAKECKDDERHVELKQMFDSAVDVLSNKFTRVEKLLEKIMYVGIGGISVLTFIFVVLEKVPTIVKNLSALF